MIEVIKALAYSFFKKHQGGLLVFMILFFGSGLFESLCEKFIF